MARDVTGRILGLEPAHNSADRAWLAPGTLKAQWDAIGRLPVPTQLIEGVAERYGKVDGVTVRAGYYDGARQLELTFPGMPAAELHVVATFGKDAPTVVADLLSREDGVGFLARPDGSIEWHTTNGFMDEPIAFEELAAHQSPQGFRPERPLTARVRTILEQVLGVAGSLAAYRALTAPGPAIQPTRAGDAFRG
jgi:hypothetical protein